MAGEVWTSSLAWARARARSGWLGRCAPAVRPHWPARPTTTVEWPAPYPFSGISRNVRHCGYRSYKHERSVPTSLDISVFFIEIALIHEAYIHQARHPCLTILHNIISPHCPCTTIKSKPAKDLVHHASVMILYYPPLSFIVKDFIFLHKIIRPVIHSLS